MTRTALVLSVALIMFSRAAKAQDVGTIDSVALIATVTPDALASQLKLKLELWVYNDEDLAAASMGFSWDNTNLQMDSARGTSLTTNGFPIGPFYYEDNNIATTNTNRRFIFGGVAINPLFPGSGASRRLWASYYFTLSSWNTTDQINIDTLVFNEASTFQLISGNQTPFIPVWLGGLHIIDPHAPPNLILSTDSLHFSSIQNAPAPPHQDFTISASSGVTDFTLTEDAPWLLVSPITGNTPRTIRLDINNVGTVPGSYIDTIYVTSTNAGNTPLYVVVTLDVAAPPPTIGFSPTSFFFNALANDTNPDPKHLTISNAGGSHLNWTVTKTQAWLGLNPTSGTDSGDVEVSVDITGLGLGTYRDTITISDPLATNNPRKVPVTLSVASDLPIIVADSSFNYVVCESDVQGFDSTTFGILNGGGGTFDYWLEWTSPRIYSITPDSGTAPDTVKVKIKLASGNGGQDYPDTVWIHSNQATNSPVPVVLYMHFVPTPAIIQVSPTSLSYNLFECAQGLTGLPPVLNFTVSNLGGDNPMDYQIVYQSDLFGVLPTTGTAPHLHFVATNDVQLPVGVYKDTILIYAQKDENGPYKLVVTLNVIPGTATPQIFLMDSSYILTAQEDHGPILPIYFLIKNRFGGCMPWQIVENIPWASILDSSGNVPDTVGIFASASGLTFGQYPDSFYVTSAVASNSPRKIKLLFKVWRFHGDDNYDGNLNILDLVYFVDYIFRGSHLAPQPELRVGDVNCDDRANIEDLTYMVDYFFRQGPIPCGNPYK